MAQKTATEKFQEALQKGFKELYHQQLSENIKRGIRLAKLRKTQELCKIESLKSR
jgi:hypothetical protein